MMKQQLVKCPSCGKQGKVTFSYDLLKDITKGLTTVNIDKGVICSHSFIVYIDNNLQIRDYFFADFNIGLPEISLLPKIEENIKLTKDYIDLDLIKLNISTFLLTYTIKAIFLKQKIVLICDEKFLYDHITNFFHYITRNSFKIDFLLINNDYYEKNKRNFKDSMVFDSNLILRNNKNLINPKKLDIEKKIVAKFFLESQKELSFHLLKNEIFKAYELSRMISDRLRNDADNNIQQNILTIQKELEKELNIKIDNRYLEFLIDIVKNYFKISVPSLATSFFGF